MKTENEAKKHFWDCERAETRTTPVFRAASEILSIFVFLAGCAVLLGWALDIQVLKSILPNLVTMKANTALCFVCAGFSLWSLQIKRREDLYYQRLAQIFGVAVLVIGLLTLSEYIFRKNLGIDQWLFKELPGAILTSSPGRMAFNTAINFTILGSALFLLASKTKNRCFFAQTLMIPAGLIATLAFIGYLYHANPLVIGLHFSTAMALHTMVLFLALFFGVFFCRPGCGIMTLVSSDALGGKLIRRLVPVTLLIPIIFGWIKLHAESSGVMSNEFGVFFVAFGNLTVLTACALFLAFFINRSDLERKKAEDEIRKLNAELEDRVKRRTAELSKAVKALESFSYAVAHDLKAPLRAMAGFANILVEDYGPKLDDNGRRVIGVINDSAGKMGQLIDDLLKLSHLGSVPMSVADIDMTTLAQSVCHEVKERSFRGRAMAISIKPLPPALGDAMLVGQIFTDLISNAMKFTGQKEKAEIGGYEKDGERVYYVKDNGAGFDMKYKDKLFGAFQQLHPEGGFAGTGIGLAIVKSAAGRHGGRVWAEGAAGQGATFYFTLSR